MTLYRLVQARAPYLGTLADGIARIELATSLDHELAQSGFQLIDVFVKRGALATWNHRVDPNLEVSVEEPTSRILVLANYKGSPIGALHARAPYDAPTLAGQIHSLLINPHTKLPAALRSKL